ncbi:hypothetical protein NC651_002269 [Populus alba x Populus x berolinensis]|nr:hypothetical protein NC651_002267 [Populus alba x Populus x berolinensis]KAJ6947856.1 hypothetical protein NC651_002268 [Populus alba x Populus x berolinensis]KAJ6947857.1 hypothetical protein NC651_002269 [Populus alba x Populus x berolinensis]
MESRVPIAIITFTLVIFLCACTHAGAQSVTFDFKNNCPYTVWPGTLTAAGGPSLSSTGFTLETGASSSLSVPVNWSGRLWARTQCSTDASGKFVCATADCASGVVECNGAGAIPPASLAEFTLSGDGGKDYYDISLVDGFNIPISITPQGGSTGCSSTSCAANVNAVCDPSLQVKGSDGTVIACKSACLAFNQPQYCCTGDYNTPDKCPPSQYSMTFKQQCPQAYSYAYDDKSSTFTCPSGGNYLITFCP